MNPSFSRTKLKIVSGYQGNSTMTVAMESAARSTAVTNSWDKSWKSFNPDWVARQEDQDPGADRAQIERGARLPGVPSVQGLARNGAEDRQVIQLDRLGRCARQAACGRAQRAADRARARHCAMPFDADRSRTRELHRRRRRTRGRVEDQPDPRRRAAGHRRQGPRHSQEPGPARQGDHRGVILLPWPGLSRPSRSTDAVPAESRSPEQKGRLHPSSRAMPGDDTECKHRLAPN